MPDARARLGELGVVLPAGTGASLKGICYLDGERVAAAEFPGSAGLGLRRTVLHQALAERAAAEGAELAWGQRVEGLVEGGVRTEAGIRHGGLVVGADGLRSRVRTWAGLEGREPRHRRFGQRRHFTLEPWTDHVEVYWADGFEAYVTPVGPREVGVAFLWSGRKATFDQLLADLPALARRLGNAPVASRDLGCGPLHQRVKAVVRGRLALVGDAGGYLDAITGEGLALAFHQAFAVVEAVEAGDLRLYARAHRRLRRLPDALTSALLVAERHPWLRRRAVAALARDRVLFTRLLGVHARTLPPSALGPQGLLRLAFGLVRSG
jgi:flavin-dependent dehydrogenase